MTKQKYTPLKDENKEEQGSSLLAPLIIASRKQAVIAARENRDGTPPYAEILLFLIDEEKRERERKNEKRPWSEIAKSIQALGKTLRSSPLAPEDKELETALNQVASRLLARTFNLDLEKYIDRSYPFAGPMSDDHPSEEIFDALTLISFTTSVLKKHTTTLEPGMDLPPLRCRNDIAFLFSVLAPETFRFRYLLTQGDTNKILFINEGDFSSFEKTNNQIAEKFYAYDSLMPLVKSIRHLEAMTLAGTQSGIQFHKLSIDFEGCLRELFKPGINLKDSPYSETIAFLFSLSEKITPSSLNMANPNRKEVEEEISAAITQFEKDLRKSPPMHPALAIVLGTLLTSVAIVVGLVLKVDKTGLGLIIGIGEFLAGTAGFFANQRRKEHQRVGDLRVATTRNVMKIRQQEAKKTPSKQILLLLGDAEADSELLTAYCGKPLVSEGEPWRWEEMTINKKEFMVCEFRKERVESIRNSYAGTHSWILVYDVTKRQSFDEATTLLQKRQSEYPNKKVVLVAANPNMTTEAGRVVTTEEGRALAKQHNIEFFETRANNKSDAAKPFESLARQLSGERASSAPSSGGMW